MELTKTKHKQTEVGLIPEDWDVKSISEIAIVDPENLGSNTNPEYEFKYISLEDVNQGELQNITEIIFRNAPSRARRKVKKNDILVATVRPNLKSHLFIGSDVSDWICSTGFSVLRCNNQINSELIYKHFFGSIINHQIENLISGSNYPSINSKEVKALKIPLPPTLTEQKAIATTLSDVDALISSLDKLISKKKAIKLGAMQELLTPKDGWKTKTIKEVATYRRGSFPQPYGLSKWYDDISGMPFVQVVDVGDNRKLKQETKQRISAEGAKMSVFVKKGSVILTIQGSIGRICITQYDAYVDRTLLIFESFLEEFNKYFFMTIVHQKFEIEKEKAPGGIIKTITKESLSSFEISYPILEEQVRITQILSDMDLEIESLENKKVKYQEIKQGMMQELLTGKTRLV